MFIEHEFFKSKDTLVLTQTDYVKRILQQSGMKTAKPVKVPIFQGEQTKNYTYREMVGCLLYASSKIRPDIAFGVNYVSRFIEKPMQENINDVKHTFLKKESEVGVGVGVGMEVIHVDGCKCSRSYRDEMGCIETLYSCLLVTLLLSGIFPLNQAQWRPCIELKRDLVIPCKCTVSTDYPRSIEMNCDRVIFTRDSINSLRDQSIVSISQRNCGYQTLPENLINSDLNLRRLDLSSNSIYRLMDRMLQMQSELQELRLADNLLGENLNPIFSSNEFHGMIELKVLDLSRNGLRSIEEGILKGCVNLEKLYLDGNNLTVVPTASLKGLNAIRVLSLAGNNIGSLSRDAFNTLGESLLQLDLSGNELSHMEDNALSDVQHLLFLNISHNSLSRFNSDVFKGIFSLLQLDLSANFLQEFPTEALRHLIDLKFLNISNNLITEIERIHLLSLNELQILDLSRNNIGRLGTNTFSNLIALTKLDLSLNALRTIEESSFEGLTKLKWLSLQDNNILLVPASALTRLPSLAHLHVQFNRIAALSTELIRATSKNLMTLGLTRNLVREIPPRLFYNFENLTSIELSGNMLSIISQNMFVGLEDILQNLDISYNRLIAITELPLRNLISLNLAGNQLKRVSPDTFKYLHRLQYLNLSNNPLYGGFPPIFPSSLIDLDISYTELKILPTVLLLNLESLERISLTGNQLQEIDEGTFQYLYNLTAIDLSYNVIEHIDNNAFVGLINLYLLNLRGNKLTSFIGEHFNTGTGLEILDLSDNRINQLSPIAFAIHPRLRRLDLSGNTFVQFSSDFIKSLQFLEWLNLSKNMLWHVNEFAFSQMGKLRDLDLSNNKIE
ncbi:PREDICTED: insulin-like growth factor-binding protein complex acid labile subunit, partial [Wasmannia auropunctata]|uniref:insulin-like growth factor-binding protein complex acid labile subunit n=1 Tax=Wasmannia auropunctata TaxID=64793 RepID=UPI0005ED6DA3